MSAEPIDDGIAWPVFGNEQAEHDDRLRASAARHPAGRAGFGVHRVELMARQALPVVQPHDEGPGAELIGLVTVPAVYAMECYTCAALLRPGPTATQHVARHRDEAAAARSRTWRGRWRRARGALYRLTHRSSRKGS